MGKIGIEKMGMAIKKNRNNNGKKWESEINSSEKKFS